MTNIPGGFGAPETNSRDMEGDGSGGNKNPSSPPAANPASSAENPRQDSRGTFNTSASPSGSIPPPRQSASSPLGSANTANNRQGNQGSPQNQPLRNQDSPSARGNFNAVQNDLAKRQSGANNSPANLQSRQDPRKQSGSGGGDKNKKGESGRSFAAWIVLALIVGGTLIWAKNRNAPKNDASVKNEQVAEVLNAAPTNSSNTATSAPSTADNPVINPPAANNSAVPKDSVPQQSPPVVASAPSPMGAQSSGMGEGGGRIAYRDPFAASIGTKLEDLRTQLVNLKAAQESQLAVADKTNAVLENFKQQLLGLKDSGNAAGDLEAQQANIAQLQENMASLHSAAEFVSLENARTVSLLSDMKTKLDDLESLVAAYNAGHISSTSI
jgi:hypothetical protein